jgi:glycosyltransferase involved in cell wall biosynthesis
LCDISGGQAKKHVKTLLHGIKHLFTADRTRYQAIQVRDMPVLAAIGLLAARIKGMPFYYWMSYPKPEGQIELVRERGFSGGLMKFLFPWVRGRVGRTVLYRIVLPHADHVFVQSERMLEDLAGRGLPHVKMTPVDMGVDIDDIQDDVLRSSDDPRLVGRRVLGYLGTLDRPRRIEILFEMLAQIKKKVPEVLLVLAGDTEDKVHLKWLRHQSSIAGVSDNVLWTGWLPIKEAWRYIMASEVGLSPFPRGLLLDSASPTKVPEYLALGIPVVCNDNPDQKHVIESSGAGLCVPYTAEHFADAVMSILGMDAEQRKSMRDGGRSYVSQHRDYRVIGERLALNYKSRLTPFALVNE